MFNCNNEIAGNHYWPRTLAKLHLILSNDPINSSGVCFLELNPFTLLINILMESWKIVVLSQLIHLYLYPSGFEYTRDKMLQLSDSFPSRYDTGTVKEGFAGQQ